MLEVQNGQLKAALKADEAAAGGAAAAAPAAARRSRQVRYMPPLRKIMPEDVVSAADN